MAFYKPDPPLGPVCDPIVAQGATARIVSQWPYDGGGGTDPGGGGGGIDPISVFNNSGVAIGGPFKGTLLTELPCFAEVGDFIGQTGGPTAIVLSVVCNPDNFPCSATLQLYNVQPPGACFRAGELIFNYTNGAVSELCESNCSPIATQPEARTIAEVTDPFKDLSTEQLRYISNLYPELYKVPIGLDGDRDPVYRDDYTPAATDYITEFIEFMSKLPPVDIDIYSGQGVTALPCGQTNIWDKPGEYYFDVPDGVNSIVVTAIGAGGGGGGDDTSTNAVWGGAGSLIKTKLKTTPGTQLKLIVGGGGGGGAGCVAKAQGGDPGWCAGSGGEGQLVTYTPDGIAGSPMPELQLVSNTGLYSNEKGVGTSQSIGTKELGGFDTTNVGGGKYISFGLFDSKNPASTQRRARFTLDTRLAFKLRFKVIIGTDKNGGERVNSLGEGLHLWYKPKDAGDFKYAGMLAPSRADAKEGPAMSNFGPGDPLWRVPSDGQWDSALDDWLNRDISLPKDAIGDGVVFELRQGIGSYSEGDLSSVEFYSASGAEKQANKNS